MTEFEKWKARFEANPEQFRAEQKQDRAYDFNNAVKKLESLQRHLSGYMLVDWFGEQLGDHLWLKFVEESNRNVLSWFLKLSDEYRFYIVTQANTNSRF